MSSPSVTVLIPTHDHAPLLRHAIESVRGQTLDTWELLLVGDGVKDDTRAVVGAFANDARIRFFDHPKGPRNGEEHRHALLASESRGEIVCYLADDDLMLPRHLEVMQGLLRDVDFAHTLPLGLFAPGEWHVWNVDLADVWYRELLLSGENRVPLSGAGHTTALYRRLPFGWRTTPAGVFTDLYMWQQILGAPDCRAVSGTEPTLIHFPSARRRSWSEAERIAEVESYLPRLPEPSFAAELTQYALSAAVRQRALLERELASERTRIARELAESQEDARGARRVLEEQTHHLQAEKAHLRDELALLRHALGEERSACGRAEDERDRLQAMYAAAQSSLTSMQDTLTWRLRNVLVEQRTLARAVRLVGRLSKRGR